MTQSKHTRGPWGAFERDVQGVYDVNQLYDGDKDGADVATIYGTGTEEKANANRIVHCVNCHDELLEALEVLVLHINPRVNQDIYDKVTATIAKARGES